MSPELEGRPPTVPDIGDVFTSEDASWRHRGTTTHENHFIDPSDALILTGDMRLPGRRVAKTKVQAKAGCNGQATDLHRRSPRSGGVEGRSFDGHALRPKAGIPGFHSPSAIIADVPGEPHFVTDAMPHPARHATRSRLLSRNGSVRRKRICRNATVSSSVFPGDSARSALASQSCASIGSSRTRAASRRRGSDALGSLVCLRGWPCAS